jgi:hypothetical protein
MTEWLIDQFLWMVMFAYVLYNELRVGKIERRHKPYIPVIQRRRPK